MSDGEDALTGLTIVEAGRRMRAGDLSPIDLTTAVLERIAATEPLIHAYVSVQEDLALAAARKAGEELRAGRDRGPLHGIPIAVKDIVDIAGLPTCCGSESRRGVPPAVPDARVVERLREAGAVIVGKTVTHEFAAGVTSPPARNPWDPTRIPGGSSGGSGASVAAGSSFAALGSDTAGSIRIPAALNGVVGLKPTYGRVSREGVFPLSWSLDTVGPLARTAEDAHLVFETIREDGDRVDWLLSKMERWRAPGWGCLAPTSSIACNRTLRRRSRLPSMRSPLLERKSSRLNGPRLRPRPRQDLSSADPNSPRSTSARCATVRSVSGRSCDRGWRRFPSSRAAITSAPVGRAP